MGHVLFYHLYETGFSNARLAAHQDHLPQPLFGLRPAFSQQGHLVLAPNQGGEPPGQRDVEPRPGSALAHHPVDRHGRRHAFEDLQAQRLQDEIPLDQPGSGRTAHHRIGRG